MSNHDDPPSEPASSFRQQVHASEIKLPGFWHHDPSLWFVLVEAEFAKRHITSQQTKYHHVLTSLSSSVMAEVRDIVISPPLSDPYDYLKQQLIKRLSESQQHRLRQLLTTEELGDRTPTQFLRRMYQLLGDESSALDESILRELFLQRLPQTVRMILSASATVPLQELSELADRIMEATPPFVNTLSTASTLPTLNVPPTPELPPPVISSTTTTAPSCPSCSSLRDEVQRLSALVQSMTLSSANLTNPTQVNPSHPPFTSLLHKEIDFLRAQVAAVSSHRTTRSFHRNRSPSPYYRRRSPHRSPHRHQLCWYHATFGNAATKCEEPCIFQGNPGTSN